MTNKKQMYSVVEILSSLKKYPLSSHRKKSAQARTFVVQKLNDADTESEIEFSAWLQHKAYKLQGLGGPFGLSVIDSLIEFHIDV
jgi:hypothetical protein